MKNLKSVILFSILFFLTVQISAQEKNLKVNPVGLAFGILNVGYESALKDNQSIEVSALYFNDSSIDISGFGAEVGYNYYFSSDKIIRGFHTGANVGALFLSNDNDDDTLLTLGINLGYKWVLGEHFSIDLFGSGKYLTNSKLNGLDGFLPGLGLSLGYTW